MDNVKRVPRDFVDLGRTLGMTDRTILRRIVLPVRRPASGTRCGSASAGRGPGSCSPSWSRRPRVSATASPVSQRYFQTDMIIGYMLVLGLLGLLTDQVMKAIGRKLFRYQSR